MADMNALEKLEALHKLTAGARRWVVKVGTSVLTEEGQLQVSRACVEKMADEIASLWTHRKEVILVTSGAIGVGMVVLGLKARPRDLAKLQAASATGQGKLMQWYTARLEQNGFHAAQVLLSRGDLEDRRRYRNIKTTLETLLRSRIVPILNENDAVSTEEIRYGDNDLLSAQVATLVNADLLVLLTDVDRVSGPGGPEWIVQRITPDLERAMRGTAKRFSTGGMRTKLEAAKIAMASRIPTWVMNGRFWGGLVGLLAVPGAHLKGTWFIPSSVSVVKRSKRWLAFTAKPKGTLVVDSGAKTALVEQGRSLLAAGIRQVEGGFQRGDLISIRDESHPPFARGLVNYSHADLERIKGLKSHQIEAVLGRKAEEVVHRDSMVVLEV